MFPESAGLLQQLIDQGGLAIVFPSANNSALGAKWIKSGLEVPDTDGIPAMGTVATYAFSDWSLSPIVPVNATSARFEAERSTTELWIYRLGEGGERQQLREVTWAFLEERGEPEAEMWVGVYAAKPTEEADNPDQGLTVTFSDLQVDC